MRTRSAASPRPPPASARPADIYQAKAAADYAGFVARTPWYQFPYAEKRAGLFAVQPAVNDGAVRNSERKLAFGFADTVKQGSAWLTGLLIAPSDPASLDIHVWAKGPVGEATREEADTLLERDFGADGTIFITRRGQQFTDMIPRLIDRSVSFVEIGGNDEIMLTVLSAADFAPPEGSRALFSQPVPVDPATRRTGLIVAVRKLHIVLPALFEAGARLEHVYATEAAPCTAARRAPSLLLRADARDQIEAGVYIFRPDGAADEREGGEHDAGQRTVMPWPEGQRVDSVRPEREGQHRHDDVGAGSLRIVG